MDAIDHKVPHLGQLHPQTQRVERPHAIEKGDNVFVKIKECHHDFYGNDIELTRRYDGKVVDKTNGDEPIVLCEIHKMGKKELCLARPSQLALRGTQARTFAKG